MKKRSRFLVLALLLIIFIQWSMIWRLQRENQRRRAGQEQALVSLEQTTEALREHRGEVDTLRSEVAKLRTNAPPVHQALRSRAESGIVDFGGNKHGSAAVDSVAPLSSPFHVDSFVLTATNVHARSVRWFGDEPNVNLIVQLQNVSSEEIGAMTGPNRCDFIIDGQVISKSAARFHDGVTNTGLVFVFRTKAEAVAVKAALRPEEK